MAEKWLKVEQMEELLWSDGMGKTCLCNELSLLFALVSYLQSYSLRLFKLLRLIKHKANSIDLMAQQFDVHRGDC